jgi:phytoene dehydrogenase-like protein
MPSIQIKNVPESTHAVLRRRAEAAHQSLQEYLMQRLIDDAAQPTLDEVLARVDHHRGGRVTVEAALSALDDARAGR